MIKRIWCQARLWHDVNIQINHRHMEIESSYFFPIQLRGPTENGWKTSFRSFSKDLSDPSQRSGRYSSGLLKFVGDRLAA